MPAEDLIDALAAMRVRAYLAPSPAVPRSLEAGLASLVAARAGAPVVASNRYMQMLDSALPCGSAVNGPAVYAGCRPERGAIPLLVVGLPGSRLQGFRLLRVEARRLAPGFFLLLSSGSGGLVYRSYVRLEGGGVVEAPAPCPAPLLRRVREILGSGRAGLRELVDAVAAVAGVSRGEARRIVGSLAARGCIVEREKGVFTLLV